MAAHNLAAANARESGDFDLDVCCKANHEPV